MRPLNGSSKPTANLYWYRPVISATREAVHTAELA
jgi:hypothetical protein